MQISLDSPTRLVLCMGSCNGACHDITKRKKALLDLTCGIGNDAFETRLEDAVEFALAEIRRVGRDLGRNVR